MMLLGYSRTRAVSGGKALRWALALVAAALMLLNSAMAQEEEEDAQATQVAAKFWYVGDYFRKGDEGYSTRIGGFVAPGCSGKGQ
jgi:hypothetical protein